MLEFPLDNFTNSEEFPFCIQYGSHEKECMLHGHLDFSELVIVLTGSAEHIVENDRYTVRQGDVFVLDRYTHHMYLEAENFQICNIMFRPEYMFRGLEFIRRNVGFQALFVLEPYYAKNHQFSSRLRLSGEQFGQIRAMIEGMMAEQIHRQEGWQTLIYARFIELCATLSRLYQTCKRESDPALIRLAAAAAYIEENFCGDITVARLARISGYSERQFGRLFKAAYETTPNQYITRLRVEKGQKLLRESGLPMGEIAWRCGFADQNYFSRTFRKATGLTPSRYRERESYP